MRWWWREVPENNLSSECMFTAGVFTYVLMSVWIFVGSHWRGSVFKTIYQPAVFTLVLILMVLSPPMTAIISYIACSTSHFHGGFLVQADGVPIWYILAFWQCCRHMCVCVENSLWFDDGFVMCGVTDTGLGGLLVLLNVEATLGQRLQANIWSNNTSVMFPSICTVSQTPFSAIVVTILFSRCSQTSPCNKDCCT